MTLEALLVRSLAAAGVGDRDRLGLAVSGGADSLALMHLVAAWRTDSVHVLHVDHGLRSGSEEDAAFVDAAASALGLPCSIVAVDVDTTGPGSIEASAREARYAALERAAASCDLRWVATAHTLDDQAETVLLRVLRGTGVGGLGAIRPVRGRFVRPLLDARGHELRDWLRSRGIAWRDDPTNADTRFERNWLRREVMPVLERRRPGAARAIARLAAHARSDEAALDALAADVFGRARIDDNGVLFEAGELDVLPRAVASRVVRRSLAFLDAPSAGVEDVLDVVSGARLSVRADGLEVCRIAGGIAFLAPRPAPAPLGLPGAGEVASPDWGVEARVGPVDARPWVWRTTVPGTERLSVRSRRPGDRIRTRAGTRKVQDVLVDAKVPRALRDLVPVLTHAGTPVAVIGVAASASGPSDLVCDVRPCGDGWTRSVLWAQTSR